MSISVFTYCEDSVRDEYLSRLPGWLEQGDCAAEAFTDRASLLKALAERPCDTLVICAEPGRLDYALVREAGRINSLVKILTVTPTEAVDGGRMYLLGSPVEGERLAMELRHAAAAPSITAQKIIFKARGALETIELGDIVMIESGTRKICAYTEEREHYAYGSLTAVLKKLDGRFLQCHKSFIVNMDYIDMVDSSIVSLAQGRFTAPISQSRRKQAHKAISEYFAGESRVASKYSSSV